MSDIVVEAAELAGIEVKSKEEDSEEQNEEDVDRDRPLVPFAAAYNAMQACRSYFEQENLTLDHWRSLMTVLEGHKNQSLTQSSISSFFRPLSSSANSHMLAPHFPASIPRVSTSGPSSVVPAAATEIEQENELQEQEGEEQKEQKEKEEAAAIEFSDLDDHETMVPLEFEDNKEQKGEEKEKEEKEEEEEEEVKMKIQMCKRKKMTTKKKTNFIKSLWT